MARERRVGLEDAGITLAPGDDAFILYTDGMTDAQAGGGRLGDDGLSDIVAGAHRLGAVAIAERIDEAVAAYTDGLAVDDAAVLVLRVPVAGRSADRQPA